MKLRLVLYAGEESPSIGVDLSFSAEDLDLPFQRFAERYLEPAVAVLKNKLRSNESLQEKFARESGARL